MKKPKKAPIMHHNLKWNTVYLCSFRRKTESTFFITMKGFLPHLSGFYENNLNNLICVYNKKVKTRIKVACVFKKEIEKPYQIRIPEGTDSFKLCVILWLRGGGGGVVYCCWRINCREGRLPQAGGRSPPRWETAEVWRRGFQSTQQKAGTLIWTAVLLGTHTHTHTHTLTHIHSQTAVPEPQQPCPQVPASSKKGETPDASQQLWAATWKEEKAPVEHWQEEDTDGGLKLCMEWNNLTAVAEA